ncbi:GNAT family N-acetyltransferase [Candidatus Xianfuyuplasma coldseepsis]|uniref:GNAT family N-acetyltransferase n=1 Tax=Candidatus Xianfuyuplasma coldseepsis TaxID=2782163 RepID=A0A7L7KQ71_9MOLU|nr:GNAT family N-acetyltransferase [Xianfuyuplasma coldseepsis]QMS84579.1 GNAT family N-acetyltransferase [Xianfuyuplasma coldseepsis]
MNMIQLSKDDIDQTLLYGFDRYMETTQVYYMNENKLDIKDLHFIESWDKDKLEDIATYLHDCTLRGGVVIVVKDGEQVIAFGNLEPHLYDDMYIHLPYIHVSRPYRNKGIGKKLFQELEHAAKKLGGTKLYISTHPSVEAQQFYQAIGCTLAKHIIQSIYEHEPYDIQLEKEL